METISIINNKVFLTLPDNPYKSKRFIGEISGDTFFTERTSKRHLLRVNNSLGFNNKLIKSGNFDFVSVNFDFKQIWTSRSVILKYGEFFHFSKGVLELQIFLCLRYFKECKKEAEQDIHNKHSHKREP